MILKKNSQKYREVRRRIEPADFENKPVETAEIEPEEKELPVEQQEEAEEIAEPVVNLPKEPEIDLFDIDDRNLVSRAQEEAETIKKSAFDEGYRKGLEQAEADMAEFRKDITAFMHAAKDVFEYIAPDILEISVDIAKKIIKKEVETDPQVLINTIVDVLRTVSKSEPKINIRVKPQAVQFIKDTLPNITYQYGIDAKINIVADPSIEEGGCVFQTNNGIVDASIDTQLEIIKKALEGM